MSRDYDDIVYKIALHLIPGIGAVSARTLISYLGGAREVFKSKKSAILKVPGIAEQRYRELKDPDILQKAADYYQKVQSCAVELISYLDSGYPRNLNFHAGMPLFLHHRGRLPLNQERMVAVVGTRKPSKYGQLICEQIVSQLRDYKVTILSGLAYGIDAVAHQTAIKLNMPTIAVLGSGLDRIYPSVHKSMAGRIEKNGALISEFPLGTGPDRENFPRRNRVIAAMADIVIVIESGLKGGSMITADYANEFSKDVFAVPGRLGDPMSEGCNQLIKTHRAHLLSHARDIAYIARWEMQSRQQKLAFTEDLNEQEMRILKLVESCQPVAIDLLILKSGYDLSGLSSILLNLEFKSLIKCLPGKKYILALK
jgi:DNA processing protein